MKKLFFLFSVVICINGSAQLTKLFDFCDTINSGLPTDRLFYDGNYLYGMTHGGGPEEDNDMGMIYKIKPDGSAFTKLLEFTPTTGCYPYGSLISDGTFLYGTVAIPYYRLFRIKKDGTGYTILFDFISVGISSISYGSLVSDGTYFYGMTVGSGVNYAGTIFKIKTDGSGFQQLMDFAKDSNGWSPFGSLLLDGTSLYGMTDAGGANNFGTVFKINTDGTGFQKLLDFDGQTNGSCIRGDLITDGIYLYGTSRNGGSHNQGTAFKIKKDGTGYLKLIDFSGANNGSTPWGTLHLINNVLYGMTIYGGVYDSGTLFKINADGTGYSKLFDFVAQIDGYWPKGELINDSTFLYGAAYMGGIYNYGTIFKYQYNYGVNYVKENSGENYFDIYPNPGSGIYTLKLPEGNHSCQVQNILGETIYVQISKNIETQIDLSNKPSGVYFIMLKRNDQIEIKKIIKQ